MCSTLRRGATVLMTTMLAPRARCGAVLLAVLLASSAASSAAELKACSTAEGDLAIAACTDAIVSGQLPTLDLAAAHGFRGRASAKKGDHERAIADYGEAIRLNPNDAVVFWNRGNSYREKGDNVRALEDYTAAIALNPDYAGAVLNRGNIYYVTRDYERAIRDYDEAIRIDPKNATVF